MIFYNIGYNANTGKLYNKWSLDTLVALTILATS